MQEAVCSNIPVFRVLIDTWWNVNCCRCLWYGCSCCVLIDTWWNVNGEAPISQLVDVTVLIDTWWNVNTDPLPGCYLLLAF